MKRLAPLVVVAAFAIGVAWLRGAGHHRVDAVPAARQAAMPVPVPARPQGSAGVPAQQAVDAIGFRPADSIEDKVRILSASEDPERWLHAYELIQACLDFERDKELLKSDVRIDHEGGRSQPVIVTKRAGDDETQALRSSCSSLTGRTRLDRFALLQRAVDRHSNGALLASIVAGPQGDADALKNRPDDPQVLAWRQAALDKLEENIHLGSPSALITAGTAYALLGQTPTRAQLYTQYLATNKVIGAINHGSDIYSQPTLDAVAAGLDPQALEDARRQADAILLAWQRRQK